MRSRQSPPLRGAAHDTAAAPAAPAAPAGPEALGALLPTVLPEAGERSIIALVRGARMQPFRRHDHVQSQTHDPLLTLVVAGHLGVLRSDADGHQHMITIAGRGEFVSVLSLAREAPPVDLVALDDGIAALWQGELVMSLARVDVGLAVALLHHALRSANRLLNRLEHVSFDSVSRRLAVILWMRREVLFDTRRPLLSRPQLASLAGTSREMTGRVIRDFEQRGVIARVRGTGLVLLDPDGLRAAAGLGQDDTGETSQGIRSSALGWNEFHPLGMRDVER